jgi:hypothetical protein
MDQFDTKGNATINTSSSVDALQLEACYPDPIRLLDTYGVLFRQSGPPTIALGSYDRRSVTGLRLRPYSGQTSTRSKVSYSDKPGARYRHYTGPFVISNPQLNCTCHYRGARYPSRWYLDSIWESLGSANERGAAETWVLQAFTPPHWSTRESSHNLEGGSAKPYLSNTRCHARRNG